ncbi:MAG: DASS family sodium-coupled anion symporter [Nitrospirae bacterium]|nr:DASS family sodium-coupled anion symporter [Nitrospirota bacterium]
MMGNLSPSQFSLKQQIGMVLGPFLGMVVYFSPLPALNPQAHILAAILSWVVVFWITEALPLPVTSLLGASFCVVFGLGSMKGVFASFAHPIIFLFIGSFFIAEAFVVHKVDRRFALWILASSWAASKPTRVFFLIGTATGLMSMWISNTAAVAIMLPIALGILSTLRVQKDSPEPYESGVMLLLAYSAAVGGVCTIIGTPPNVIGVGLLAEQAGISISFFEWMMVAAPLGGIMFVVVHGVLFWLHPVSKEASAIKVELHNVHQTLGVWTRGQINTCVALGVAIGLWLLPGFLALVLGGGHASVLWLNTHIPKELAAILAAGLLFLLPINLKQGEFSLSWKQASNINWGTILLFGGGLAFGHQMVNTGLAEAIGQGMVGLFGGDSLWGLTAISILTGLILTEMASNTAAASMLVPVVIAIAQSSGLSPVPPTLGVCMAASLAFVLPVSTPPNAMVYGTGLVPLGNMVRAGLILDFLGGCLIWIVLRTLCPLLGLAE